MNNQSVNEDSYSADQLKDCPNCGAGWFRGFYCYDCGTNFLQTAYEKGHIFEEMLLRMIEARDKCYPSGEPDPTNAHQDGDEVLCETIREAAKGNINPEQAESIIKIWEDIRKWYD